MADIGMPAAISESSSTSAAVSPRVVVLGVDGMPTDLPSTDP